MISKNLFSTMIKALQNRPFTIAVEGNIGSGKTTFLNHIEKLGNATVLAEPIEKWRNCNGHNLLALLYEDPKKHCFTFQSYVQLTLLEALQQKTNKPFKFVERSIYSARYCFVEKLHLDGIISHPEYSVLDEWFQWITRQKNTSVDLFVYLRTDPEVTYKRIMDRGRREETNIPLEYIKSLHEYHERWLSHKTSLFRSPPVFTIDANVDLSIIKQEYDKFEEEVLKEKIVISTC